MPTANASATRPATPPHTLLMLGEGRAVFELAAFCVARPLLSLLPKGDGHPVLVLPGFMTSDTSTKPMRHLLAELGYETYGWELGRNVRINGIRVQALVDRLLDIHRQSGQKVSLIGWSLGGLLARELAKVHPEAVRQVISLGGPISDERSHSNVRHLFEIFNDKDIQPVHDDFHFTGLNKAPPVPTTSILTRGDGVLHWRGSVQHRDNGHEECENIEVIASHMGLIVNPSVMVVIADRLTLREGAWKSFSPSSCQQWMFPTSKLE